MSVLNAQPNERPSIYVRKSNQIKRAAKQSTDTLLQNVIISLNNIWEDEDPQAVLDELGTSAQELFELNAVTVEFLVSTLTGKRDADLVSLVTATLKVLPHTVNGDGTVTID